MARLHIADCRLPIEKNVEAGQSAVGSRRSATARWLLALVSVAFAGLSGCVLSEHHIGACPEVAPNAFELPSCCRNRVYFFLFGDCHPCHDMDSLRERLIDAGYVKVYCGKCWHLGWFSDELKKIHEQDAEARFVIVSQGGAAPAARELACTAGAVGVAIDLFVYLDAVKEPGPVAARQILAIHGEKDDASGAGAAQEYLLADAGLEGAAGHPQTLALLLEALAPVAGSVAVLDHEPKTDLPDRPVSAKRDNWDFLRPDGQDTPGRSGPVGTIAPGAVLPMMRPDGQP